MFFFSIRNRHGKFYAALDKFGADNYEMLRHFLTIYFSNSYFAAVFWYHTFFQKFAFFVVVFFRYLWFVKGYSVAKINVPR